MKKEIELHKKKIEYTLKVSKRAKRMRLAIYCDGNFVVTAPRFMTQNIIEQFILKKSHWVINKLEHFKKFPVRSLINGLEDSYAKYKMPALEMAQARIEYYNEVYGLKFNKINIKNQKSRWGSCSRKGNLNFNYKIALLPKELADYIIVHELCHLKEFNHSRKFWDLVAKTIPRYIELRRELKKTW